MQPKHADRMANSADPDRTEQSELGLHCLLASICLKTEENNGNIPGEFFVKRQPFCLDVLLTAQISWLPRQLLHLVPDWSDHH